MLFGLLVWKGCASPLSDQQVSCIALFGMAMWARKDMERVDKELLAQVMLVAGLAFFMAFRPT